VIDFHFQEENADIDDEPLPLQETRTMIDIVLSTLENNALIEDDYLKDFLKAIKPYTSLDTIKQIKSAIQLFDFITAINLIEAVRGKVHE
jgi:hypothetical protein